jgi:hypothetical protein
MGDGLLVEFPSVVDALRCAVEVQQAKTERNAGVPADHRIEFRIGINLGDVIVEGDDIHGDGVNIADRLQGLAEPGGIVISGTAYDQVEQKLAVGYEFRGKQRVKNIDKPVRVYRACAMLRVLCGPPVSAICAGGGPASRRRRPSRSPLGAWRGSSRGNQARQSAKVCPRPMRLRLQCCRSRTSAAMSTRAISPMDSRKT